MSACVRARLCHALSGMFCPRCVRHVCACACASTWCARASANMWRRYARAQRKEKPEMQRWTQLDNWRGCAACHACPARCSAWRGGATCHTLSDPAFCLAGLCDLPPHPVHTCARACRHAVNACICQHAPARVQNDTKTKLDRETERDGVLPWRGGAACRALPPMFRLSSQRRRGTRDSADKATQTLEGAKQNKGTLERASQTPPSLYLA